jgi:hypothetical protein
MQLFNSYYDLEADKALSITSLVARFEKEGNSAVKAVCDEGTPSFSAVDWKGYTGPALRNMRRAEEPFQSAFDKWIKENITTDYQNSSLMYCHGSGFAEGSPSTGAHTDFTRDYVLMYNMRIGGENAELTFYKEKGKELIRERGSECGSTNLLEIIDSVKGPANTWYLINARVLHSVEKVDGLRLNLQISFDRELPENLL